MAELGPRWTGSMKGTSTERPPGEMPLPASAAVVLAEASRLSFLVGGAVLSWKIRPRALASRAVTWR